MDTLNGFFELLCLGAAPDSDKDSESLLSTSTAEESSEEPEDLELAELVAEPQEVARSCTDLGCCFTWLLAMGIAVAMIILGSFMPERHDFIRLSDGRGTQCGVYTEIGKAGLKILENLLI